jgi:hypothetical protein
MRLERLADQARVPVEHRRLDRGPGADPPVGREEPADRVAVDAELGRDRPDPTVLDVEQVADVRAPRADGAPSTTTVP